MGLLSCFKGGQDRPKRPRRRRRGRQSTGAAGVKGLTVRTGAPGSRDDSPAEFASPRSALSDEDYFDAVEEHSRLSRLSVGSVASVDAARENGAARPPGAAGSDGDSVAESEEGGLLGRVASWWHQHTGNADSPSAARQQRTSIDSGGSSGAGRHAAAPASATPPHPSAIIEAEEPMMSGCISLLTAAQVAVGSKRYLRIAKPLAGSSFTRHSLEDSGGACCWREADATTFSVRSQDYMRTKIKELSSQGIYRLVGVDMYSFDFKLYHIAQHVELPKPPTLGPAALALPPGERLPPLLVINLQLPVYLPTIFGANDGPGHSLVYYFALPEEWEPDQVENKSALGLVQRFVHNGREFDGQPTRDRLKLIPRIVNVEEWVQKGPLSSTEARLLRNYNDKPLLTRPQQRFFTSPDKSYLEWDLDVHSWAYIARRAYHGYISRLAPVVFENAFVVQGNRPEELPEVVLAAARVYHVDFTRSRPFPARSLEEHGHGLHPDGEAPPP